MTIFQIQDKHMETHKTGEKNLHISTGRFIMFSVITNIYNKKKKDLP
jgi:hypothetical protein